MPGRKDPSAIRPSKITGICRTDCPQSLGEGRPQGLSRSYSSVDVAQESPSHTRSCRQTQAGEEATKLPIYSLASFQRDSLCTDLNRIDPPLPDVLLPSWQHRLVERPLRQNFRAGPPARTTSRPRSKRQSPASWQLTRFPEYPVSHRRKQRLRMGGRIWHGHLERLLQLPSSRDSLSPRIHFKADHSHRHNAAVATAQRSIFDAPVQEYCQAFPKKDDTITTRQVLGHLGGIRHYKSNSQDDPETGNTRHFDDTIQSGLKFFADDPLVAKPGTVFHYSTQGFTLVGCALEGASGENYVILRSKKYSPPG